MFIINNFKISINRNEVLKAINSYYDLSHYDDLTQIYEDMYQLAIDKITPFGAFEIEEKSTMQVSKSVTLHDCRYMIFCIFTLGDEITEIIDNLFDKNEFTQAIILDAISTSILFHLSKQMYNNIYEYSKEKHMGLTCRIAPGDGEIDINYQKNIVEKFDRLEEMKFSTVNDYIIKPYKTLTYIYGADNNIKINREDHHCNRCQNKTCFMRNSTEKTRGAFIESDSEDSEINL
jgi:hypothetical protein